MKEKINQGLPLAVGAVGSTTVVWIWIPAAVSVQTPLSSCLPT